MSLGSILSMSLLARASFVFLVGVLPVRLTTSSGESVEGELTEVKQSRLTIQTNSESIQFGFDELLSLVPQKPGDKTGPTSRVTLVNGSRIAAQDYSLSEETLTVEPRRQDVLLIPVKQVKAIRFRAASPITDPQWNGLFEKQLRGDLLVIRRERDRLDPTEGIVESIESGKVGFDLDGETVQAPLDRLEGVVFGGSSLGESTAQIQITDIYGSHWRVDSIETEPSSDFLVLSISGVPSHTIPITHIDSIRWSGALMMLASQPAAESSHTAYFESSIDEQSTIDLFGPRTVDDSDLVLTGDSFIEYRIDEGYQQLAGGVQRDHSVTQAGEVIVRITMDDKVVWSETITDTKTLGFDLPVGQARRLRFQLDTGDDGPVGDIVRFLRPRLLK